MLYPRNPFKGHHPSTPPKRGLSHEADTVFRARDRSGFDDGVNRHRGRKNPSLQRDESAGVSLNDPVVKFGAFAGIVLIGSGLLMKTYHKYFGNTVSPAADVVSGAVDAVQSAGGGVSDVVGDISHEAGETVATVPYEFAHGVYGVGRIAAADVWRAFIASGESGAEAGRQTQAWIDDQVGGAVSGAAGAVSGAAQTMFDWLTGAAPPGSTAPFEFGGGSTGGDAGFGGGWDDDPVDPDAHVPLPGTDAMYQDYLDHLASGVPVVSAAPVLAVPTRGDLQDIFIEVYGSLPAGVAYVGDAGHATCVETCEWRGRGTHASHVCTTNCSDASVYANYLASHSMPAPAPATDHDFVGAPSPDRDRFVAPPSGDGSGNAGRVPSGGPGMPDYS